jgi:hypothetical protein
MFAIGATGMTMTSVMAVMHEQVHQRAGRDQEVGERTEDMGGVLAD